MFNDPTCSAHAEYLTEGRMVTSGQCADAMKDSVDTISEMTIPSRTVRTMRVHVESCVQPTIAVVSGLNRTFFGGS